MSVSSIFNPGSSPALLSVLSAPTTTATTAGGASVSVDALTSAASATSVSSDASLLFQLQADAQQASGSRGQALSSLAARFRQASQTGDLSPLQSAHGRHGGHPHGGGGSSASAAAAYQQNSDAFGVASASTIIGDKAQPQLGDIASQALTQTASTSAAA